MVVLLLVPTPLSATRAGTPTLPRHPTDPSERSSLPGRTAGVSPKAERVPAPLPWLHASPGSPVGLLETSDGSYYPLRGVDVNGLLQYGPDWNESIPLTASDFSEMHALGLTFVRLSLSWSELEPSPGAFNQTYLAALSQVVDWAGANGLYVLVDMHQDLYNRYLAPNGTEQDGFPTWATFAGNASRTCPVYLNSTTCLEDPAVDSAWNAFWNDTTVPGYTALQQAYVAAWQELASTFANSSTVAGYDLMNEPATGDVTSSLGPGFCPNGTWEWEYQWEDCYLLPFYQSLVHAIRQVDARHAIFFEPSVYTDALNWAPWNPVALGDPNVVYEPHIYTEVFGPTANWSGNASALASTYANAQYNAEEFGGVPWFVGEYGTNPDLWHDGWIEANLNLANQFDVGSSFWEWKDGINVSTVTEPGGSWGLVDLNGSLRSTTARAEILSSPHPVGAGGAARVVSSHFDFTHSDYVLNVTNAAPGGWVHVYLPSFWYPSGSSVSGTYTGLSYANSTYVLPGNTVLDVSVLNATCSCVGNYTVVVLPRTLAEGWLLGNVSPSIANVTVQGSPVTLDRGNFTLVVPAGDVLINASAPGYLPRSQNVTVAKGGTTFVHLALVLRPSPPSLYPVQFTESGLPSGSSWSVTVNGTARTSPTDAVALTEPNGTYPFRVAGPSGYTASPASGAVTVAGQAVNESVVFSGPAARATYVVVFSELGLPAGTTWSVSLNGSARSSTTATLSFPEPNATYSYTVLPPSGYSASPGSGTVTVRGGAPGTVGISFTRTPTGSGKLTAAEGYVLLTGVVVAVAAATFVLYRRRRREAPPAAPSASAEPLGERGTPSSEATGPSTE